VHTSTTNPENNPCIQTVIRIVTKNLIIYSLANCQPSLKILCKSVGKFLRKVANRQTNIQTNNDDYIPSLAEVMMFFFVLEGFKYSYNVLNL